MSDLVKIQEVFKTYGDTNQPVKVLQGISCVIETTNKVVVSGESGSGKTTLLSVISGLDTVDSGHISIGDAIITSINEEEKASVRLTNIGFVFQHHYLLQDFDALGNVALPLLMQGIKKTVAYDQALTMLQKVGLEERKHHNPKQLSGGECQRVAIARALVHNPLLILADEPTGALDARNSEIIRDLLCSLVEELSSTIIIATHDKDFLSIANKHWNFKADGTLEQLK